MTKEILDECERLKRLLEHKAEEIKAQELLKDIDMRRSDWERRSALFVPSKQRLERGGRALELGEDYERIKELRILRDKSKLRQSSLREEMTSARTDLQNAGEALTLAETEYRDKLTEQTQLANTVQRVKALDEQIIEFRESAVRVNAEFEEAERRLRECTLKVEIEQISLEKVELALREARKFLHLHSIDEKLGTGIAGIQKCFTMYEQAEERRQSAQDMWAKAITRKQQAQSVLNDRAAQLSDVTHRHAVIERNYARARSFYESTLKGRSISEWRDICERSIKRLAELDELYAKFQEEKSLQDKLKQIQDAKLRIQQETRSLNIRDVEQTGKIHELQEKAEKLARRASLLHRIEDLEAVRELLQDGIPCPLCGSLTHPYVSGASIPDPEEIHSQLDRTQQELDELKAELTARQTRTDRLNDEISAAGRDESDLRKEIAELNTDISSRVSLTGIRFGTGISPFEELDRARQRTRDDLQLARNAADTAEAAERDMKAAGEELKNITETREEAIRFHQEALFSFQTSKSEEEQFAAESKAQEEIVTSLKRELLSQITPYGYQSVPDKNPVKVIESLTKRLSDWQEGARKSEQLERELSLAGTRMSELKKEREALRARREELAGRVKAAEAERDSVSQQRVIIFASRNPDDELSRMSSDVEILRARLNERRESKNESAARLDRILTALHGLETEMAKGRENLQRHEINFGKRLLALGFRNEDDYAAACLTSDERRDLQNRLRELTQTDLELNAERENTMARVLELQADKGPTNDELTARVTSLKESLSELSGQPVNDTEEARARDRITSELIPAIKDLMLTCGLPEVL